MQKKISWFKRNSAPLIICTGALLTGIISFLVTVKVYDNDYAKKLESEKNKIVTDLNEIDKDNKIITLLDESQKNKEYIAENDIEKDNHSSNIINNNGTNSVISNDVAKTSQEYLGDDEIPVVEINEEDYENFVAILIGNSESNENKTDKNNTVSSENSINSNNTENKSQEKNDNEPKVVPTIANVKKEELTFISPVSGEIGMTFASEKLVYSNTLKEWITHNGIDIIEEEAMPVKAIENGIVESIKMDPRYGNTIIIKHNDEYKSVYSNLSTIDLVYVGKKVEKGDIISGVGAGFGFESAEKPHVHLEILKNGKYVNPIELISE